MSNERIIAAVDLGSNSFHMIVAEHADQGLQVVDRLKETVRLGSGLDRKRRLDQATMRRALECLERFGQRIRGAPKTGVRAVGTSALRMARNSDEFRIEASRVLGYPVEVVSGHEEARLIYIGVGSEYLTSGSRLVVDIGGGSTEIIAGESLSLSAAHSLHMGCVTFTERFFAGGSIARESFEEAEIAARLEVRAVERSLMQGSPDFVIGSSGTIQAIERAIGELIGNASGIDLEGLRVVKEHLLHRGHVRALKLESIKASRAQVLAGGLAILLSIFEVLGLDRMKVSQNALREGLLADLVGRRLHDDVRDLSVQRVMSRTGLDREHAGRVEATALVFLEQVGSAWNMDRDDLRSVLAWAARLHEVGLWISHRAYHKHGAYLLSHASLDGFSDDGQRILAAIVRGHRRKFSYEYFEGLLPEWRETAARLCVILRLAVLLHRGRGAISGTLPSLHVKNNTLVLRVSNAWLREHPLTAADLEVETKNLRAGGCSFRVSVDSEMEP